jgi:hypothetical protein
MAMVPLDRFRSALERIENLVADRGADEVWTRKLSTFADVTRIALHACAASASVDLFMGEPPEKKLAISSFAIHSARGLIRDQNTRRTAMFVLLVVALVLLFSGAIFLRSILNPRQHPVWFILFWFVCIWFTFTALLLAIFDILIVRAQTRKAGKILRAALAKHADSPMTRDDE